MFIDCNSLYYKIIFIENTRSTNELYNSIKVKKSGEEIQKVGKDIIKLSSNSSIPPCHDNKVIGFFNFLVVYCLRHTKGNDNNNNNKDNDNNNNGTNKNNVTNNNTISG